MSEHDEHRAAPTGPLRRVGIGLSYDGAAFHGFAAQPGQRTVAGLVSSALEPFGLAAPLVCAGRTDAGVHALAQVVHADLARSALERLAEGPTEPGALLGRLARALDRRLGGEVVVWRCRVMRADFDARRAARSRRYRYTIATGPTDPLRRGSEWGLGEEGLDLAAMRIAADSILGEHDFSAFCRRPRARPDASLTRRVTEVRLHALDRRRIAIELEANAFCHQMVRALVGTLVSIGRGHPPASELFARLRARTRAGAATLAPAHGLCLVAVRYADADGATWSAEAPD